MSSSRSGSSSGAVLSNYNAFPRSLTPSGRFSGGGGGATSFASSYSSFSSTFFHQRSSSPTRVNFAGMSSAPTASVRFSLDRPTSPGRSLSYVPAKKPISSSSGSNRKTCMCSPTTHPGSFRCSLHKGLQNNQSHHHSMSSSSSRLNARRSAMTNSLVRIGTVEGDLVKRALAALIRPSSHQQKRRASFQPRPSRLSIMTKADDL